jgi:ribosome maturation protein SDO1
MAVVEARLKVKGKSYEILVDLDEALKVRSGSGNIQAALQGLKICNDVKKGTSVSQADLTEAFGTTDVYKIATQIIQKGEVQKNQEFRDAEREKKIKQIVSLIIKNATDQHGRPYTEERIKRAIDEVHYAFDNSPAEQQMVKVMDKLKTVIPIKIEVKRIKLTVPAQYTGHVYGILNEYKESEEWLSTGALQTIVNVPAGLLHDFYEKLNHVTHGAVHSEELKQEK